MPDFTPDYSGSKSAALITTDATPTDALIIQVAPNRSVLLKVFISAADDGVLRGSRADVSMLLTRFGAAGSIFMDGASGDQVIALVPFPNTGPWNTLAAVTHLLSADTMSIRLTGLAGTTIQWRVSTQMPLNLPTG